MSDALRSLFLEAGVDDRPAVGGLQRITLAAKGAEQSLIAVARASDKAGRVGMAVSANARLTASYNALAVSAARAGTMTGAIQAINTGRTPSILQRPGLMGAGDMPFILRTGGTSNAAAVAAAIRNGNANAPFTTGVHQAALRTGRGNFGLGTSVFLATAGARAGGYAFQQGANLERASLLASFANGQTPGMNRARSLALSRGFNLRLGESTGLTQEIAQLGAMSPEGARQLARAGAGFHTLEGSVGSGEAAAAIYRLIKATSRSEAEFERGTAAATRYAGAIYAAGNESAAGAGEVFSMVQELEPLAQFMQLGANGTIALSAAFADLNANQRELFRGALTRMVFEGKLDPNNPVGSLLSIAERLRKATSDSEKLNILKALGFDNIRDVQTISVMAASMDTFARSFSAVNEELVGTSKFEAKVGQVLGTMSGQWDGLKSSMDSAAASMIGGLAPALGTVLSLLTGIADTISGNPGLALLLGGAGVLAAGAGVRSLYRRHFGGPMAAEMLAGMLPNERRAYGRTSRAISTMLPIGMSKRLAFTGFGANLAEGAYLGSMAGAGRFSSLSLGLMRSLPFIGEGMATGAASRMAAGGLAGRAIGLATGPVGWIMTALSVGAPLFQKMGDFFNGLAEKAGPLGIVLNTVSLIFDVLAAGGRILNKIFGFVGDAFGWMFKGLFGENVFNDINSGFSGAHKMISGIAADETKAGAQTPKAPGVQVSIYTGGSQSGMQTAMDEVSRRAVRTMPNTYGGVAV